METGEKREVGDEVAVATFSFYYRENITFFWDNHLSVGVLIWSYVGVEPAPTCSKLRVTLVPHKGWTWFAFVQCRWTTIARFCKVIYILPKHTCIKIERDELIHNSYNSTQPTGNQKFVTLVAFIAGLTGEKIRKIVLPRKSIHKPSTRCARRCQKIFKITVYYIWNAYFKHTV